MHDALIQPPKTGLKFEKILNESKIRAVSGKGSAAGTLGEPNPNFQNTLLAPISQKLHGDLSLLALMSLAW